MIWRRKEPIIYIGPAPRRRRRRKWIAVGLIMALVAALVLAPGRPRVQIAWQARTACAETCTITNWWGNWVGLGKLFVELRHIWEDIQNLRNLIAQKWDQFMRYRRQIDYALSVLRDPEEALRDYLLREAGVTLTDLFREEEARLRTRIDTTSAQLGAALDIDHTKFHHQDWIDFATEAKEHAREMAKALLRRAQAPGPVQTGGRRAVRQNEQAIQLQLPSPPSEQEVAEALKAANPASGAEAARETARAVAARKWAERRMREAVEDLSASARGLVYWDRNLSKLWAEIDRLPYTSSIKTLTKISIQNQVLLFRILRQVAAQNLVSQAQYAQIQADRAARAVREAQAEAVR